MEKKITTNPPCETCVVFSICKLKYTPEDEFLEIIKCKLLQEYLKAKTYNAIPYKYTFKRWTKEYNKVLNLFKKRV